MIDDMISDPSFEIEISSYEKHRNLLYLDPESWNAMAEDIISQIRFDWKILREQYYSAFEVLNTTAPLELLAHN